MHGTGSRRNSGRSCQLREPKIGTISVDDVKAVLLDKEDEEAICDYLTELFANHAVSDKTHAPAKALFGVPGVVEMTALSGYYGMVSMQLLAHEMPLPEGATPSLEPRK